MKIIGIPGRQGDILLIQVDRIPEEARPILQSGRRLVLAEGESTGHTHAILDGDAVMLAVSEQIDLWLRVRSADGVVLTHDEHDPITIPSGNYIVRRQVEYSPSEVRRVAD